MSALSGIDIALWDLKGTSSVKNFLSENLANKMFLTGRSMGVSVYSLLGGKVRDKVQIYAWIGGDRPSDVAVAA